MPEVVIILVIALIVFGAGKLPDVMGSLGKGIREFKKSTRELDPSKKDVAPGEAERPKEPKQE